MVSNKNGSSRNNAEKVARATSTRDGLWNVYSTDQTTPEQRSMILADHGTQIKQKFSIVSSKSTAHLLDPSILIPDYPDQTDVSVVEHDIVLSNSSSRHGEKGSPVALCYPTAQVQITFSKPHWTLTTLDKHGNKKHIGGDEFYIVYRDNSLKETSEDPTAIALIQDYENGTYTLDFITIPTKPPNPLPPNPLGFKSLGNLTVYFDYTCGIGSMAPPSKRHWDNKGSTSAVFTRQHVPQPPIRTFQHPTKSVNMSSFDFVNFIGASTMRNLVDNADERWQSRVHLQQDFRSTLNTTTVDAFVRKINRPETLQQQYGNNNNSNPKNVALILGSDVWDILSGDPNQGSGFEDHLLACARAVQLARQVYPNVTILWKYVQTLSSNTIACSRMDIAKLIMFSFYSALSKHSTLIAKITPTAGLQPPCTSSGYHPIVTSTFVVIACAT
jgi:hypothetical protein